MSRRTSKQVMDRLAGYPVFSRCTEKELRSLAGMGTALDVEAGHVLTSEGRRGVEFFVILEGTATCTIGGTEVARLGPGEFFGEMSLLEPQPRSATVVAATPMQVLVIDAREFATMLSTAPSATKQLLRTMAQRLRTAQAGTG
jgi:CRP/FNR family transcriptional regulator, cyclic AMP receptor protein